MTRNQLEEYNVGENLDALMHLDPRGYGVCRILQAASRQYTGQPVAMHAAKQLCNTVKQGTSFGLCPLTRRSLLGWRKPKRRCSVWQ